MKEKENIENMIYEVRGVQVMLDSDLARLYQCKNGTKEINQAVKRNLSKFPIDFYFQLSNNEYLNLKSQNVTSNSNNHGGLRKMPHVFTEQGVAMLASVLKTDCATEVSIKIIRAFVKMRHFIIENENIYKSINNINIKLIEHDEKIDKLFSKFEPKEMLFLENKEYDAYFKIFGVNKLGNKCVKESLFNLVGGLDETRIN